MQTFINLQALLNKKMINSLDTILLDNTVSINNYIF